jgi:hypothetical protein
MPKKYILTSPDEDDSQKSTYYNKDKEWWQSELKNEECAYDTEDEARVEQIFLKIQYQSDPNYSEYPINIQSIE